MHATREVQTQETSKTLNDNTNFRIGNDSAFVADICTICGRFGHKTNRTFFFFFFFLELFKVHLVPTTEQASQKKK